jgi:hypothetical protein
MTTAVFNFYLDPLTKKEDIITMIREYDHVVLNIISATTEQQSKKRKRVSTQGITRSSSHTAPENLYIMAFIKHCRLNKITYKNIAKRLNTLEIPTPSGNPWTDTIINQLISGLSYRETYLSVNRDDYQDAIRSLCERYERSR